MISTKRIRNALRDGSIEVDPLCEELLGPSSIGLRLGNSAYKLQASEPVVVDEESTYPEIRNVKPTPAGLFALKPREVLLAPTLERVSFSEHYAAVISGTSDLARLGVSVTLSEAVAPGFGNTRPGILTLELVSHAPVPILVKPGMRICKMLVFYLSETSEITHEERSYGHSGDADVSESKLYNNIHSI